MATDPSQDTERLLAAVRSGDLAARDRLIARIYEDVRRAAARLMWNARPEHTLQPTALANEALLKLLAGDAIRSATDREHIYRAAVQAMRQVLIDHHRRRSTAKRVGGWRRRVLDEVLEHLHQARNTDIEALDEALDRLAAIDARACLVTTFHAFLGLDLAETARALEISLATAERDWKYARSWLRAQLRPEEPA